MQHGTAINLLFVIEDFVKILNPLLGGTHQKPTQQEVEKMKIFVFFDTKIKRPICPYCKTRMSRRNTK